MPQQREDEETAKLEEAVRGACPATDDLASRVARSRVAAGLFGAPDRVRIGRYELERLVGEGGGGVVFAAWDPELSRRIAIELIDAQGRRDRVLAEAHALARLAHPNVVSIFDVGTYGDQIFLVMELVDGATLRAWVDDGPHTMREIVRAYRQAAEGLAAAHRAGFVHRDFKPDNALIGSDGRVRVVDFGLVHVEGSAGAPGAGTPRYMAPEQLEGGPITLAVDQYAFCAALREAAARRRDASGARIETIPRWIEALTSRGLSRDPHDRYPSFEALLRALASDPATRWKRRGLVAGMAVLGVSAFVVGRAQTSRAECPDGHAELAAAWGPASRAAVITRLAALPTPYANQIRPHIIAALDAYADHWVEGQQAACAARDRGTQSDALFDRRISCLDRARAALSSVVGVLNTTSADQLAHAVTSLGELPALERCSDPAALDDRIEPPPAGKAAAVAQLDRELVALEVQVRAGRAHHPEVREAASQLVARARVLGYRPLLARALRVVGVASLALTARDDAIAPFREGTTLAFAAGADELGVELFARRAWAEGTLHDPERALAGLPVVEALASRLPDVARPTRALLANNVGSVELAAGNTSRARERFEQSMRELEVARGGSTVELAQVPANLALVTDDPVQRTGLFARTIEQLTKKLGADHPLTLDARIKAAANAEDAGLAERELALACTAYRELHPEHGAAIGDCAFDVAWFALDRGDTQVAHTWFTAVVAALAHGGDATQAELSRAHLARLDGDARAALAGFARIFAMTGASADAPWWQRQLAAEADLGAGLAARDAGDRGAARQALMRAATTLQQIMVIKPGATRRRALERARRELAAL